MRLARIEFTNFRCFRSDVIEFDDLTTLVGPNNCGKSTVLRALSLFFGGNAKFASIQSSDFHIGAPTEAELSLKFEFADVDGDAEVELSHYVRSGRVVFEILATRDQQGAVSSHCRGIRFGLPDLAPIFAASTATARKPLYEAYRENFPEELPAWQNMPQVEEALRAFEQARAGQHVAIPSGENAYGVAGPVPKLRKYLDWIYVPAVKDASTEASEQRDSAFSKLIMFAVRSKYNFSAQIENIKNAATDSLVKILSETSGILGEVGREIDREFKSLTTTPIDVTIDWDQVEGITVKEPSIHSVFKDGQVFGLPEAFGHGLQRTYLMALLSLATKIQNSDVNFKLLLGVEEPELYQHPPQARFLANALASLAIENSQVIISTHSPHFVSGRRFDSIRVLRKRDNTTRVYSWTVDQQRAYCAARKGGTAIGAAAALSGLDKALQPTIAELFFAGKVIFVEGQEDIGIIESYLKKRGKFLDFLRAGCHLVAVGGKTKMHSLVALARGFYIDYFCIFDFDMNLSAEKRVNSDIIRYAADAGDHIATEPVAEFSGTRFFGWYENIQATIEEECAGWKDAKSTIASEWGWSLDRMDKDPMLLDEAVSRIFAALGDLPPLRRVCDRLELFWSE